MACEQMMTQSRDRSFQNVEFEEEDATIVLIATMPLCVPRPAVERQFPMPRHYFLSFCSSMNKVRAINIPFHCPSHQHPLILPPARPQQHQTQPFQLTCSLPLTHLPLNAVDVSGGRTPPCCLVLCPNVLLCEQVLGVMSQCWGHSAGDYVVGLTESRGA